jgi:hypothetical protein
MGVFINSSVNVYISTESIVKQTYNFQQEVAEAIDTSPYIWDDILNDLEDMAEEGGKIEPADFDIINKFLSEINTKDCIEILTDEIIADTTEDGFDFEVPFEVDVNKLIQLCRGVAKK